MKSHKKQRQWKEQKKLQLNQNFPAHQAGGVGLQPQLLWLRQEDCSSRLALESLARLSQEQINTNRLVEILPGM